MTDTQSTPAGGAEYTNGQFAGPLRLTFGRWFNRRVVYKDPHDGEHAERWSKVLAHRGQYADLFAYGTDTDSDWNRSDLQVCTIHAPNTGTIGVDVDAADEYLARCPLAAFIRREHAVSTRGGGWHVVVDMRGVPRDQWPTQGPVPGGDLKANGFLPVPGSTHYSGERYEPVIWPGNRVYFVTCTPQILAAMHASRALMPGTAGSDGSGGSGGGHDGEIAAQVLGWVRQAVNTGRDPADLAVKGEIYQQWLQIAIAQDPGWPFTAEDFERHYRTAVAKVNATPAPVLSPEVKAWAASTVPAASGPAAVTSAATGKPPRPGLDSLVSRVLSLYTFARDVGGELFLLPGAGLRAEPWIPRSFLTRDVINLGHVMWRAMAREWNAWVGSLDDAERKKLGVTRASLTPGDTTIRNAAAHLEAVGMATGRKVSAALRAVQVPGGIIIDLGDETGLVAHVTAQGWQVTDPRDLPGEPPVFRRSAGYLPLPHPVPGGDLDELWSILRIGRKDTQALAGGWVTGAYFADVPRPGIFLTGAPGSGKTTAGVGLARLIDGLEWLDGKLDKTDERNNIIRAVKCYVPSFDNMTQVSADQSEWICQLVTGHRDMFRRMRTNFEDISMAYKRTFAATGLVLPHGLAAEALDRVIEAPMDPIPESKRVSDAQIRRELDAARPRLLGALLSHVAAVLAQLGSISEDQGGLSRMNGYARILMAHDRACGTRWLDAYQVTVRATRAEKAAGEPVVAALAAWLVPGNCWGWGKIGDLLAELAPYHPANGWWPANERALSVNLTKNHGVLESEGIHVVRSTNRRMLYISRDLPQVQQSQ